MAVENVTSASIDIHLQFNYHSVDLNSNENGSIHIDFHAFNSNLSYLMIWRFNLAPIFNATMKNIDGWILFCSESNLIRFIDSPNFLGRFHVVSDSTNHSYFIENSFTHRSLVFGLRELTENESLTLCSNISTVHEPIISGPVSFSANYKLRLWTSSCFFLDDNSQWKSDGLRVGRLSNVTWTQCFSTHLTKFSAGFSVLPKPLNWNFIFSNGDFLKNKTIYLTVIVTSLIGLLLLIYARRADIDDDEKVSSIQPQDNFYSRFNFSRESFHCWITNHQINISMRFLYLLVNVSMLERSQK